MTTVTTMAMMVTTTTILMNINYNANSNRSISVYKTLLNLNVRESIIRNGFSSHVTSLQKRSSVKFRAHRCSIDSELPIMHIYGNAFVGRSLHKSWLTYIYGAKRKCAPSHANQLEHSRQLVSRIYGDLALHKSLKMILKAICLTSWRTIRSGEYIFPAVARFAARLIEQKLCGPAVLLEIRFRYTLWRCL